ncbi:MAG: hypothetical protein C4582_00290 [Desulfobacteraceae bacterium]|jgi:sRNA-binding regulator protein Hfq|nr:MAG: hypothetical protein C4582_00290 [Desulfobacteraceae bacterium]
MTGHIAGLEEYLAANYGKSVFDTEAGSGRNWMLHTHGNLVDQGVISENLKFDICFIPQGRPPKVIPKVVIKLLYPSSFSDAVSKLLKTEERVKAMRLEPIIKPTHRNHVKNKTLFPLMKDRSVLFFTLLEGEVLKGIIQHFSRYEITLSMKGEVPVTILRHSIYDLRDKRGRCLLKSFQDIHRDWEKSPLFSRHDV